MKLIVGLGNPGNEYSKTRHNIGFQLLDYIASSNNIEFKSDKKFNAECATCMVNGEKVHLIKPLSYMNLSGIVVSKYANFYNIASSDILVIQDDLDMDFGKIRILYDSTSGGHNGIKNIIECLGTKEFTRLKIGISNNKNYDTKDYVLGKFSKEESDILTNIYSNLENIINDFIELDTDKLKQKYNSMNNFIK